MAMKKICAVFVVLLMIFTTGCSLNAGIDTLLYPPQLTNEQMAIKQALIQNVGKDINLKYPKSGTYRSAFVIADIDGEPTDEAIAFYQRTGIEYTENNIRINILDQKNGEWISVFDHAGSGTDIDKIMLTSFSDESKPDIVIGYSILNQNDKIVQTYSYDDGQLKTLYNDSYAIMDTVDIDGDSINELMLITGGSQDRQPESRIIKKIDGALSLISETEMDPSGIVYSSITKGYVTKDIPAVFVDTDKGDGTLQTQIIYAVDGQMRNPIAKTPELMAKTTRPSGYFSMDIDNDGVVEIPTLSPFPGYETVDPTQKIYITDWMAFEQYALVKKNSGYYNINKGYCFMLPSRWQGAVTVKPDTASGDVVFYKYEGEIKPNMKELMRISVVKTENVSEKLTEGYQAVYTKGRQNYMVKISGDKSEPLVLTMSEIMYNLIII